MRTERRVAATHHVDPDKLAGHTLEEGVEPSRSGNMSVENALR